MLANLDFLHIIPVFIGIITDHGRRQIFHVLIRGQYINNDPFDIPYEDFAFILIIIGSVDIPIPINDTIL